MDALQATPADAGLTLDRFLARHLSGVSIERARTLCAQGRVRIRGKVAGATRKLWGNEQIELATPKASRPTGNDDGTPLPVLHDDAALVVVDKPAGLAVDRSGETPSVVSLLSRRLTGFHVDGQSEPGVVHRLDRDTSGCLALPKTDAARAALLAAFEQKQVDKRYVALVLGEPPDTLELDTPYGRSKVDPRLFTTKLRSARRARLSFRVRERFQGVTLLEIALDTGRTHQIRVQLCEAGFPVLGDAVYGPQPTRSHPAAVQLGRHALHAESLALPHPADGSRLAFSAAWPTEMRQVVEELRGA